MRTKWPKCPKTTYNHPDIQNHDFWARKWFQSGPIGFLVHQHGVLVSRTGCERLNRLRQVFLKKTQYLGSRGEGSTNPPGGTKIWKIMIFELGTPSRVVRSASYCISMEYPWVEQVASIWTASDKFFSQKIDIWARGGKVTQIPQGVPKSEKSWFSSSEVTLEWSVRLPTASAWGTHG